MTAVWQLVRAVSLANVLWLPVWERVLYSRAWGVRSAEAPLASLTGVVSLAVALWSLETACRRWGRRSQFLWSVLTACALLVPLNVIRRVILPATTGDELWSGGLKVAMVAATMGVILWAVVRHRERMERLLSSLAVVCLPFVGVTVGQTAGFLVARHHPVTPEMQADGPRGKIRRTVVLLFDELDYVLAFERRRQGIQLEEFDRLAARSFRSQLRPAGEVTLKAVPAMLAGRVLDEALLDAANRLWVRFRGEEEFQDLASVETLFQRANQTGARIAVVGAWLPYCALVPPGSRCWQVPLLNDGGAGWEGPRPGDRMGLLEALARHAVHAIRAAPLLGRWVREDPQRWYMRLLETSLEAVSDSEAELVWVHVPLPHPPWIFDRIQQRVTYSAGGYDDNLVLVDRMLGALRQGMEQAGLWRESVIVVTSDHGYRAGAEKHTRVPLMVRFPDEVRWEEATPAESTVLRAVVEAVLKGEVRSGSELARLLFRWSSSP